MFPPKTMQHPRRHPSPCTFLPAVASGGGGGRSSLIRLPWRSPLIPKRGQHFGIVSAEPGSLPRLGARDRKLSAASQSRPDGKVAAHGDTSWGKGGHGDRVGGRTPSVPRSDAAPGAASPRRCRHHTHPRPRTGTLHPRYRSHGAPAGPGAPSRAPPRPEHTPQRRQSPTCVRTDGGTALAGLGSGRADSGAAAAGAERDRPALPATPPPGSAQPPDFLPRPFPSQTQSCSCSCL